MADSGRTHKRGRRRLNKAAIWAQFREAEDQAKKGGPARGLLPRANVSPAPTK